MTVTTSAVKVVKHALDHGSIAVLAFDRAKAKNAVSRQLLEEFSSYIDSLQNGGADDVRALVLSSTSPDVFCAGADLKERKTFTLQDTKEFLNKFNSTLTQVQNLQIPTITAVQGVALGGGLEISLSTDLRVFGTTASVGLPETRLAIVPGAGGTHRLPALVGYSRAIDIILTGRRVSPDEALLFGLCNRVVENAEEGAIELARTICQGGPLAINAAKRAIKGESAAWEQVAYREVVSSEDKFEALKAFAEKRKPNFKGR